MLILGTDTSSKAAVAAIMKDGEVICEYTLNINNTHSEKFLPLIEQMLSSVNLTYKDIDVFACGLGPGSFTGIRIGVATIKGLCGALKKKAVGVSSILALAYNAEGFDGIIVPTIYARADEVFCGAYYSDMTELLPPSVMTISELTEKLKGKKAMFSGDGATRFSEEIKACDKNFSVAPQNLSIMRGASICRASEKLIKNNEFTDYTQLCPVYLRQSQAEREYTNKNK